MLRIPRPAARSPELDALAAGPSAAAAETTDTWVSCDRCGKWRRLRNLGERDLEALESGSWYCEQNPDVNFNSCGADEEPQGDEVQLGESVALVDHIVAQRVVDGQRQFLVRWTGFGQAHDSWVEEVDMVSGDALQGYVASQLQQQAPQPPQEQEDAPVEEDAPPPEEEEKGALPMEEGAVDDWAVPTEELFIPPEAVHEQPASRPGGHRRIVGHRRSAPPERVWLRVPDELDRQPRDPVAQAAVLPPLNGLSAAAPATPVRRSPPPSSARTPPRAASRPYSPLPVPQPSCFCGTPAVWLRQRWWCAREVGGCAFEVTPSTVQPPLCECGAPASLHGGVWWLCNAPNGPSYRCNFARRAEFDAAHAAERIDGAVLEAYGALGTAALLTAAAFGPMGPWCFVSPSDDDLGLFARVDLGVGQAIGEYGGPRLPAHHHRCGRCVLLIPGTSTIIDAACENSPYDDVPRYPATFVMHSRWPNARLETWADAPGGGAPPSCVSGCGSSRSSRSPPAARFGSITRRGRARRARRARTGGTPPSRPSRKTPTGAPSASPRRRPPPPSASSTAWPPSTRRTTRACRRRRRTTPTPTPTGRATSRRSRGAAITAATSGYARSCRCCRAQNPYNWALIATHVHGRGGRECQQRWRALMREAATSIPKGAAAADADAVAAHEMESGELEASPGAAPPSVVAPTATALGGGAAASGGESAAYDDDVSETASNHSIHAPPLDDDDDDDNAAAAAADRRRRVAAAPPRAAGKGAAWQGARRPRRAWPAAGAARSDHGSDSAAGAAGRALQACDGETGRLQLLHAPLRPRGAAPGGGGEAREAAARALRLRDR